MQYLAITSARQIEVYLYHNPHPPYSATPLPLTVLSHTMSSQRVLLLGGHGKISLKLTPLLLAKSWSVTSVVRSEDHRAEILALGKGQPGKVEVLVESLDDVRGEEDAKRVIEKVGPTAVVFGAGAGGKVSTLSTG
jgi:nucleoside-diphosphate-sugar epimerase